MDTPTHALIPVIVYGFARRKTLADGDQEKIRSVWKASVLLAIAAALPDALDPHITLQERWDSWTHNLTAWLGFTGIIGIIAWKRPQWFGPPLAAGLSLAYFSHLIGDAIAGGIAWGHPFSKSIIGDYYVPPAWWKPLDIICIVAVYGLFRVIPMRAKVRRKRALLAQKREGLLQSISK